MSNLLTAIQEKQKQENYRSVRRLLTILIGSVFFIEMVVMDILLSFTHMSKMADTLVDATLLSLLLFPIFYFLIFRPLTRNIAEREKTEAELRIAAVAFEIKDPTIITDASANIIRANQKFLERTGYNIDEIVGKNPRIFKSGLHNKKFYERMWHQLLQEGAWSGEIRIATKEGRILHPFWLTITAVKNAQQETTHYIGIYNF
ncbi:PAS domain-containing protein [Sideroxydans lithotrophicus]|uniref:Putative PAS/PAC sensor protein n=1 Tax=Sideroxydans lithotrophicus (strain ES-1) TaxID=580332 RepID=D5CTT2_SIDLE|nr:PAS domain S-box protein [Sideroxydans lithotrophicus]ADE12244.1 putative PAS/PAC sensor protein [Sideroxydans lithotrophicus ES-1]